MEVKKSVFFQHVIQIVGSTEKKKIVVVRLGRIKTITLTLLCSPMCTQNLLVGQYYFTMRIAVSSLVRSPVEVVQNDVRL